MRRLAQQGYVLIATITLSLAIAIVAIVAVQYVASTSLSLSAQNYQDLAQEAANSGITYANSCLTSGTLSWTAVTPATTCTGSSNGGSSYLQQSSQIRSTFSVSQPDAQGNVLSTGTVQILNGTIQTQSYTATSKMNIGSRYTYKPIASGEVITDLKAQNTDCAIANGKLYCWGRNSNGSVGDNSTIDRSNPVLIQGALAGKTVTAVDVSDVSVCAIADGTPYCWGDNGSGQLGSGNTSTYKIPTANVPKYSSGDLSGSFVTDIGTAPMNVPAIIWPLATAAQHTCALKANGSMGCWGSNGFRQLSTKGCAGATVFGLCVGLSYYPNSNDPILVAGYDDNTGPFAGKKATRVGASSHDSCLIAQGRMYCMGVEVPLNITCNSVLFYPANVISIDLNPCTTSFSPGYDMSSKSGFPSGYSLNNKFIDPSTWELGTNLGCGMANTSFFCVGNGSTVGIQWGGSWNPPWEELSNADVTSHDSGENEASASLDGIYCAIDKGVAKCNTSLLAGLLYNGGSGVSAWGALNTTAGLAGNIPTKIAAGTTHGCLAANGQLFCWGLGSNGRLANGSTSGITYASHTGTGGSTPIGTTDGSYAADGPMSVGNDHSCGTANGRLFCWGKNTYGQLGMDDTNSLAQPQAVPAFATSYVTKVSAGGNHTCAIKFGQLYCWGLNSSGQLGLGNTTNQDTPQLVTTFSSKRVTDVSAGVNNTCAIADGQAYCWGDNSHKKLGDGTLTQRTSPVLVNGTGALTTSMAVTKISAGANHTCAVANADAYCWGWNDSGRTGLNVATNTDNNPALLTGGIAGTPTGPNSMRPSVSDISAGGDFTCGIFNGKVGCWGLNSSGQLGIGTTNGCHTNPTVNRYCMVPQALSGTAGTYYATSISTGTGHACALIHGNSSATNGNTWCWGVNTSGQLGNNSTTSSSSPVLINGGGTISSGVRRVMTSVAAGDTSTCGVANGVILCWGNGADGRLGTGFVTNVTVPSESTSYRFVAPYQKGPIF